MAQTLVESVKNTVLDLLVDAPLTMTDLSNKTKINYYTVRLAVRELENEGRIMPFDRGRRNVRYTLGTNTGPNHIIPFVKWKGNNAKLTRFDHSSQIPERATEATHVLYKSWATIAMLASRLGGGLPETVTVKRLNRQRAELIEARTLLENVTFLMNQFLDNDKLWDPHYLAMFPNDKDWPEFEKGLQALYDFYYEPTKDD